MIRLLKVFFFLLLSSCCYPQATILGALSQQPRSSATFTEPDPPLYNILGDITGIWESPRLVVNTNNDYGIVDASGVPTTLKSITPGPTGRNLTLAGTGTDPLLVNGSIYYFGQRRHRGSGAGFWNYMSFASPFTNLKYTIYIAGAVGSQVNPDWFYALIGNNTNSTSRKGIMLQWDDRVSQSRSNGLTGNLTNGSGYVILSTPNDILTPNSRFVLTIVTDGSQAAGDRQKFYINNVLFAYTTSSPSTTVVTTPNFDIEVGGIGNGIGGLYGSISHVVFQSRIELDAIREAFTNSLLPQNNRPYNISTYVDETRAWQVYETYSETGRYYFVNGLLQNPFNTDEVIQIFHDGDIHIYDASKNLSYRKSSDRGRTYGARVPFYDPAGAPAIQDASTGIDANGRIHVLTDNHISLSAGDDDPRFIYLYSDDFGATWSAPINLTASVPNDGLLGYRAHGNIIQVGNYLYSPFYKFTDEGVFTNTARYILRLPLTGSTAWEFFLVETGSTFRTESSIQDIDSNTILMLNRNDATKLWTQYVIDLPTMTSINQGNIDFGEATPPSASPPRLTKFKIGTTDVIMAWILNRSGGIVKYVLGTSANLKANGLTGWTLSTKTQIANDTQMLHYGAFLHPNNTFNAIGAFARDPATYTENTMVYFDLPTTNYAAQKTALGL